MAGHRSVVKTGIRIALSAGAAAVLLAACERGSAVASRGDGGRGDGGRSASQDRSAPNDRGGDRGGDRGADRGGGYDQSDANVRQVDGKAMWSSSKKGSAEENAQRSFARNGQAFGARDLDDYLHKAHTFVDHPPAGVEQIKRRNGDVLFYDSKDNVFAVANRNGVPKAMFKPDKGGAYWSQQKDREANGGSSARAGGGGRTDG